MNRKAGTGGGGALTFTGDHIDKLLRYDDGRAEKTYATQLVFFTMIEYGMDRTIFSKLRYTQDNTYRQTGATLEGFVSTLNKKLSRYTLGYKKF